MMIDDDNNNNNNNKNKNKKKKKKKYSLNLTVLRCQETLFNVAVNSEVLKLILHKCCHYTFRFNEAS